MNQQQVLTLPPPKPMDRLEATNGALSCVDEALGFLNEAVRQDTGLEESVLLHLATQDLKRALRRIRTAHTRKEKHV